MEERESEILRCIYCNECEKLDSTFQKVICVQWRRKDGSLEPPKP